MKTRATSDVHLSTVEAAAASEVEGLGDSPAQHELYVKAFAEGFAKATLELDLEDSTPTGGSAACKGDGDADVDEGSEVGCGTTGGGRKAKKKEKKKKSSPARAE